MRARKARQGRTGATESTASPVTRCRMTPSAKPGGGRLLRETGAVPGRYSSGGTYPSGAVEPSPKKYFSNSPSRKRRASRSVTLSRFSLMSIV